jgi:nucleoside-diphosphate-sugar epimerase
MANSKDKPNPLKVLVTGGSGFLGQAIVREFLEADCPVPVAELRILDLKDYDGPSDDRIHFLKGDICNPAEMGHACEGIDLVIHSAALVDWGTRRPEEVYHANFEGTENLVRACKEMGVPYLVHTSSLDTVITGKPLVNIDESQPYPEKHLNMYCESKYLAEKLVLAENSETLMTCALRPADIYGEGDPYHMPPLIDMAKSGFYVRIGDGRARNQHVYVRNIAWAHVLAAKALLERNAAVAGNAYFITDTPASNFFDFFDELIMQAGYRIWPARLWLPRGLMYFLGAVSEGIALLLRPIRYYYPKLSRFAVMYTCTEFTFSSEKAAQDFGFSPKYGKEEAKENTARYFQK